MIDENLWIFVFVIYFSSSFYDEIHSEFDFGDNLNFPFKAIFQSQFQINFFPIPLNSHQSKMIGCLYIFSTIAHDQNGIHKTKMYFFPLTPGHVFVTAKSFSVEIIKEVLCL